MKLANPLRVLMDKVSEVLEGGEQKHKHKEQQQQEYPAFVSITPAKDEEEKKLQQSSNKGHRHHMDNNVLASWRWGGTLVAVMYGAVSMTALLVNKAVLSNWEFNFPLTMIACQMIVSFIMLQTLKTAGFISFDAFSFETAKKVAPLSLSHVANVLLGLAALNLIDVPMFGTLRRTSIVFVLIMEYILLKKSTNIKVILCTLFMIIGALVGGWGDLHFDIFGYSLTFLVNITTALSLTLIPKLGTAANLNAFGLMLYQITVSFPVVVFFIIVTSEYRGVLTYQHLFNFDFQISFLISCAQIFFVNYTLFLCTQLNSPLTTTVTGTIKNVGETILGFFFFRVPLSPINLLGICIGFSGSCLYTIVKYYESAEQQKREQTLAKLQPEKAHLDNVSINEPERA